MSAGVCLLVCLFILDRVSLCSSGCSGSYPVDQAGLDLRDLPASAFQLLGLRHVLPLASTINWFC